MLKTAIILGASGLTGRLLLEELLKDERYSRIKLFVRSPLNVAHEKIQEFIVDLLDLENHANEFQGDEVFCCIGTTKKKTPKQDEYRRIDFGIPMAAAKLCKENEIDTICVISSVGATSESSNFYLKTKGEMEQAILGLDIPNTYILRPSLIVGDRQERRAGEKFTMVLMRVFNPLLFGGWKKYRSIKASTIARAMIQLANNNTDQNFIESNEIQVIGAT